MSRYLFPEAAARKCDEKEAVRTASFCALVSVLIRSSNFIWVKQNLVRILRRLSPFDSLY